MTNDELVAAIYRQCCGVETWMVMDADEKAYCISFDRRDSINPEREANEWLARQKREFPEGMYSTGYKVVKRILFSEAETLARQAAAALQEPPRA